VPRTEHPVVVVGAGISGIACARVLHDGGVAVRVIDRGHRIGGRMAVRTEQLPGGPHPVDIGASYFTARDERFAAVAQGWREAGLAREWTDTFHVLRPRAGKDTTTGLSRWAAPGGLRSLVEDLAQGLDVTTGRDVEEVTVGAGPDPDLAVDGEPAAAVVLAMPEPQAQDLLPEPVAGELRLSERMDWTPAISVWAAWGTRWWPELDGAFVEDSQVLSWVADDGRRRGDGAPVLVAHTTAAFADDRLDDPGSAAEPVLAELGKLFGRRPPEPELLRAHRWSLASPGSPREEPFGLHPALVGLCGDGWGAKPRVEQAWTSGTGLGEELLRRLGPGAP